MATIGRELIFVDQYKRELAALGETVEDATVAEARQESKSRLAKAENLPSTGVRRASACSVTSSTPLLFPSVQAPSNSPKIGL